MRLGRRKPLTAAQQYVNLRANPLSSGDGVLRAGSFTWRFDASPSPLSRVYRVRIEMAQERSPRTFVETPDLALLADGRDLPHVYRNPTRLCLYLPRHLGMAAVDADRSDHRAMERALALVFRGLVGVRRMEGRRSASAGARPGAQPPAETPFGNAIGELA
jgi:hypothetical protein